MTVKPYYFYTEKLCVGYNGKPLIQDVEITLPRGQILTLIGPNGAGKSTVLKSIAGQLTPIGGVVYLGEERLSEMKPEELAKNMSVVLTEKLKTELMTCEDVVATGRYPYTGRFGILSKEDHRIVEEAMELVHVTGIRAQDFGKISDGQKQRVMLARAICQEPELLILDEPTSYLDVKYKLEFLSILQELKVRKGLTVIMSLHELELAERVSDQILCLKGTYVEKYGTPKEIFRAGYIKQLFDINTGSFDEENGSMELEPPVGVPEVFVIAGGGSGRHVYRRLQREGKAFVTGILYPHDLDFPVARALAAEVIVAEDFEPISRERLEIAKKKMDLCSRVICCKAQFGSLEWANQELLAYARQRGKEVEMGEKAHKIERLLPEEIEKRSFEIISEELLERGISLPPEEAMVTKRVIHTSADFDYAGTMTYSQNAVAIAKDLLLKGADIVTDTNMALAGINKKALAQLGGQAHCFMADADVAKSARQRGVTRAVVSMEKAKAIEKPVIFAIGNAPTALIQIYEMIQSSDWRPAFVIGVPVGFVNVEAAKELMMETEVPYIVNRGRKGGSNVAAAICNALLYELTR